MTAIAIAMVIAMAIAVGVMCAAVLSHQLANSPELRALVRKRWHRALMRLDDLWMDATRGARDVARSTRR